MRVVIGRWRFSLRWLVGLYIIIAQVQGQPVPADTLAVLPMELTLRHTVATILHPDGPGFAVAVAGEGRLALYDFPADGDAIVKLEAKLPSFLRLVAGYRGSAEWHLLFRAEFDNAWQFGHLPIAGGTLRLDQPLELPSQEKVLNVVQRGSSLWMLSHHSRPQSGMGVRRWGPDFQTNETALDSGLVFVRRSIRQPLLVVRPQGIPRLSGTRVIWDVRPDHRNKIYPDHPDGLLLTLDEANFTTVIRLDDNLQRHVQSLVPTEFVSRQPLNSLSPPVSSTFVVQQWLFRLGLLPTELSLEALHLQSGQQLIYPLLNDQQNPFPRMRLMYQNDEGPQQTDVKPALRRLYRAQASISLLPVPGNQWLLFVGGRQLDSKLIPQPVIIGDRVGYQFSSRTTAMDAELQTFLDADFKPSPNPDWAAVNALREVEQFEQQVARWTPDERLQHIHRLDNHPDEIVVGHYDARLQAYVLLAFPR